MQFSRVLTLLFAPLIVLTALAGSYAQDAPTPSDSRFDGPAELPRLSVASALSSTPAPGKVREVRSSDNLQTVLNEAQCGDKIQLQQGATYEGSFVLPAKDCDDQHWIVIRSNAPDESLPREGERITPCYAGVSSLPGRPQYSCSSPENKMAKLVADKGVPAVRVADGANHYRIGPGLELTRSPGDGVHYALIARRQDPTSKGISHVVIDRDWIHGTPQDETVRGIFVAGWTYSAVVDSYLNDFHCIAGIGTCTDSQAIAGGVGEISEGPLKIENNFLEAGAENILFGGSRATIVPTDITIRHNHLFKPLTWMPGQPGFIGGANDDPRKCVRFNTPGICPFVVKNLFELKNAQRVLFEGNILENSWPGFTQRGGSIVLQVISQGGPGNPNATVADITVRYNRASHAASGIVVAAPSPGAAAMPKLIARISIHDDVFDDISPAYDNGVNQNTGVAFQVTRGANSPPLHDIAIDHVTMIIQQPQRLMILGAPLNDRTANFVFTNNIVSAPPDLAITGTGPAAPCGNMGQSNVQRWESCTSGGIFEHNILIGASGSWPHENRLEHSFKEIGFAVHDAGHLGDYHLPANSRYKRSAGDGRDPGADIDMVERATNGAE